MKKRRKNYRIILLLCFPLLLGAGSSNLDFDVQGLSGKLLENVKARLSELQQSKPLAMQTDEQLGKQVAEAIQPYGYFRPEIKVQRQPLRIEINAGPQAHITQLKVGLRGEGKNNIKIKAALTKLPIALGQAFNSINYEKAKQELMNVSEEEGFLNSTFEKAEILIDKADNTAKIDLIFNTNFQYYFGKVQFAPSNLSPNFLERFLPFHYGEPYSTDKLLTLNNQLSNSGYFQNLSVEPQINNAKRQIPIKVLVKPTPRTSYSLGIGYGTDTGLRGRAGYHLIPVNSSGHKFNAVALGSLGQSIFQAQYIIPGKNPVIDSYHITGNLSALDYNAGFSKSALLSFAKQHNLSQYQRTISINALYDGYHYKNQSPKENFTLYPKTSFTWLKTKDKLFSPSGYSLTLTGLGATKYIASAANFVQAAFNAKAAITLPSIRTRFYFHTIQGLTLINSINQLPLSLALLLGGTENLKGFDFNSIGPGKILSYGGIEIQKEFKEHWYFIGFFDSGDVFIPRAKKFKNDAGVGLMWVSPIGPIKIGLAQSFDDHFNRLRRIPKFILYMGPDL